MSQQSPDASEDPPSRSFAITCFMGWGILSLLLLVYANYRGMRMVDFFLMPNASHTNTPGPSIHHK